MAYNLKSEEEVKQYLENLGIEYRFGCFNEKNAETCHLLGDYLEAIKKDYEKASKVYKDNCDERNFGKSCYKYGNYRLLGKGGKGEQASFNDSLPYFEKGCALENPESCLNFGLMLTTPPVPQLKADVPRGVAALKLSCTKGNANACYYLSGIFISGIMKEEAKKKLHTAGKHALAKDPSNYIMTKNMEEAFKYSEMACNLDHMYSCVNVSQMYQRGEGVTKNVDMAEKFKKIAIEMEDSMKKKQQQLEFQQGLGV